MTSNEHDLFLVFPYLKTSGRCRLRGIQFRSNNDISDLPPEIQRHLDAICKMFFVQDAVRIEEMTCAHVRVTGSEHDRERQKQDIQDAYAVIAFIYCQADIHSGPFMPSEFASIFVFKQDEMIGPPGSVITSLVWPHESSGARVKRLDDRKTPESDFIPGYECTRNFARQFWVADGSRIFPELPMLQLNHVQDLFSELSQLSTSPTHWTWARFVLNPRGSLPHIESRVLLALQWYLRSCRESILVPEAVVHLGIALETLLGIESEKEKTERLKDALTSLLGPVPRLDSWFYQFYEARSGVVHEGEPGALTFRALEGHEVRQRKKLSGEAQEAFEVFPLIAYGRRIFRCCLEAIVSSAYMVRDENLAALFVHNQERLESICKTLDEKRTTLDSKYQDVSGAVGQLDVCTVGYPDRGVNVKSVLGVVKRLFTTALQSGSPISGESEELLRKFIADDQSDGELLYDILTDSERALVAMSASQPRDRWVWTTLNFLQYALRFGTQIMHLNRAKKADGGPPITP